jgi:tetratricopeptide (TPR) repeat protein
MWHAGMGDETGSAFGERSKINKGVNMSASKGYRAGNGIAVSWLVGVLFALASGQSAAASERATIHDALLAGQFERIERILEALQRSYKSGAHDDQSVAHAFRAFESTDREFDARLEEWVTTRPHSAVAHAARGIHIAHLGWTARGTRFAHKTSARQMEMMRGYFQAAQYDLKKAIIIEPTLSVAYAHLVKMTHASSGGREAGRKLAREALRQCPRSFVVRYFYLFGLQPTWGGSMEEMRSFMASLAYEERTVPSLTLLRGFGDFTLGDEAGLEQKHAEAIAHYSRALANGSFPLYLQARARARRKAGLLGEALADLNTALALMPDDTRLLHERAELFMAMEQHDLARSDVDRALGFDPLAPNILLTRAKLHLRRGMLLEALEDKRLASVYEPE